MSGRLQAGQPKLRVEMVPTDELVPYAGNAKEHPESQIGEICESIKQFGFSDPVGAWHDAEGHAVIVEGHGRVLAARELGMETVPVVWLDHLDDEGRRAYGLVHNQLTMGTGWDDEALQAELEALGDVDMDSMGFADMLAGMDGDGDVSSHEYEDVSDEPVPDEVECRCKLGDTWMLGAHRIRCGSATSAEDMDALAGGASADLLLTDPPYGISYVGKTSAALTIDNDSMSDDEEFSAFLTDAFRLSMAHMADGASFYVWHADIRRGPFLDACAKAGMEIRECLVWAKNTLVLGRQDYQWRHEPCLYGWKGGASHRWFSDRKQTTVLEFDKPVANAEHPTMKPVPLFAYLIENSTREGDVVLDPFGGSGTTLIACERLGRRCLTMELDPHYCDVIIQRWEDMTGQQARRA